MPRFWVYASGVVELVAGERLDRRTARAGGAVATAAVVAVYPANIKAAVDSGSAVNPVAALTWLRLPFQFPLFAWALGHAGADRLLERDRSSTRRQVGLGSVEPAADGVDDAGGTVPTWISMVMRTRVWIPPLTSVTSIISAPARIDCPTFTGDGKRTLSAP